MEIIVFFDTESTGLYVGAGHGSDGFFPGEKPGITEMAFIAVSTEDFVESAKYERTKMFSFVRFPSQSAFDQ